MNTTSQDAATDRRLNSSGAAGKPLAKAAGIALPTRARWVLAQTWAIPKSSNSVYVTPFVGAPVFNDGDVTMNGDYTFTVNTTGMYIVSIGFDWADNPNQQVGLRINGIEHGLVGPQNQPPPPPGTFKKGQLTVLAAKNDRIGQYDVSSTNFCWTSRFTGPWKTGTVGKNSVVSVDVTLATPGVVELGDVATASHTGITAALSDGVAALVVTAKVIAPDTVRVSIWNSSPTHSVTVPNGTLNVIAMSTQTMTGDAPRGRSLLMSAAEALTAGDSLYGTFKSTQGGDQLLASPNTFIHIERWA